MRSKGLAKVVCTSGVAALLMAAESEPVVFSGDYDFVSSARVGGQPACSERWRFHDDGTLVVESDGTSIRERFHVEGSGRDVWLVTEIVASTRPDCVARDRSTYPRIIGNGAMASLDADATAAGNPKERRLPFARVINGSIVLFWPIVTTTRIHAITDVGSLRRAEDKPRK